MSAPTPPDICAKVANEKWVKKKVEKVEVCRTCSFTRGIKEIQGGHFFQSGFKRAAENLLLFLNVNHRIK